MTTKIHVDPAAVAMDHTITITIPNVPMLELSQIVARLDLAVNAEVIEVDNTGVGAPLADLLKESYTIALGGTKIIALPLSLTPAESEPTS